MAAIIGNLPIKILAQAPNAEPVEIGTYELPVHLGPATPSTENTVDVHLTVGSANPEEMAAAVTERLRRALTIPNSL